MSIKLGKLDVSPYLHIEKTVETGELKLQELTINPSKSSQTFNPDNYSVDGFSIITVNPVTAAIDPAIRPENIKSGVTILGVEGTASSTESSEAFKKAAEGTLTELRAEDLEGVKVFRDYAFYECELTNITLPDSLEELPTHAFRGYHIESFNSEEKSGALYIGSLTNPYFCLYTGYYNSIKLGLREYSTINQNTKLIFAGVAAVGTSHSGFKDNTSLVIPESVIWIGKGAFLYENGIKTVHIPSKIKVLSEEVFYHCSKLERVTFSENSILETIGRYCFGYCDKLTDITLPSTVKTIDSYVFRNTPLLTSLKFAGTMVQWSNIEKSSLWNDYSSITQVICSDGTVTL